ncbi:MAG: hypothetical protein ACUVWB_04475 [Anaerolineae bacterium]
MSRSNPSRKKAPAKKPTRRPDRRQTYFLALSAIVGLTMAISAVLIGLPQPEPSTPTPAVPTTPAVVLIETVASPTATPTGTPTLGAPAPALAPTPAASVSP